MADSGESAPHVGPAGRTYHHVGSGHTESVYWCPVCEGWYGVPHDGHNHWRRFAHCACRPCQEAQGVYPKNGVLFTHDYYRRLWASGDPRVRTIEGRLRRPNAVAASGRTTP